MRGLDVGTHLLCVRDTALPFHIDKNEVVVSLLEQGQPLGVTKSRIDVKTGESKNPVAQRAKHLAAANMQNRSFFFLGRFHFSRRFSQTVCGLKQV